jgi:putative transposase
MSMPRQAKLDTPGALHHVMGRGIEGCPIFRTDFDRADFLGRRIRACNIAQSVPRLLPSFLEVPLRTQLIIVINSFGKRITCFFADLIKRKIFILDRGVASFKKSQWH